MKNKMKSKPNQHLGKVLARLREKAGLSQTELASRLGFQSGPQFVRNWEYGIRPPSIENMKRMEVIFKSKGAVFRAYVVYTNEMLKEIKKDWHNIT